MRFHTYPWVLTVFLKNSLCPNQIFPFCLWNECVLVWPFLNLTSAQICDLPPGTINDITNEHNLTVHWTEKHTHRDCALYTGDLYSIFGLSLTWSVRGGTVNVYFINFLPPKVELRVGAGTPLLIRSFFGTVSAQWQHILVFVCCSNDSRLHTFFVGVNSQWKRPPCYSRSYNRSTSCKNWSHLINVGLTWKYH